MSRIVTWQRQPSDAVSWRQDQALQATIYILRELGPTSFLLKEDGHLKKFKVSLGDPHLCDCADFKKEKSPCKHICWLLIKKFKLDRRDELSYQLGLVEREINEVLHNPAKFQPSQAEKIEHQLVQSEGKKELDQRPLSQDDVCPICQEALLMKRQPVTYCRYGCGNSVHIKCMKVWVDHQRQSSSDDIIMCPFCRGEFADPKLLALEFRNTWHEGKTASDKLGIHTGVSCNWCRMNPIKGKCYRCDTCESFHLCNTCFHNKQHPHHSFVFRLKKSQRWRSAPSRDQNVHGETLLSPIINELQTREITENDYDVLLRLDRPLESSASIPVDLAGLPDHVINRLPMSKVKEGSRLLAPGRQCRLCLHCYTAGQLIRRLPECGHIFHRQCIDEWLSKDHRRCPVDRALVVVPKIKAKEETSVEQAEGQPEEGDQEMVVPGVGLVHFSSKAVGGRRNKTSPSKQRMKPVPVKHFTPSIGVTMSELLVQADAIRLDGAGANRFASQHQDSVSLASNFVPNVPSLDSVFSKVGVPQQKRLEGKNEAMRKARLRKFAKKSEPCNDLLEFSLNGTRYSKTTVEGQNSFDDHRLPRDAISRTLIQKSAMTSIKNKPRPVLAKKTTAQRNENFSPQLCVGAESSTRSVEEKPLRNQAGARSAPPSLISKKQTFLLDDIW